MSFKLVFIKFPFRSYLILAGILLSGWTYGQTVIFSENMGAGSGTQSIAANVFENPDLVFSGTADTRSTGASTGYTGASGGKLVFFTNSGNPDFIISNISTSGFTDLELSFGAWKSTTASNLTELILEYSTNGTTYTQVTFPAQPTGSGTAFTWRLITTNLPVGVENIGNLYLRWRQTASGSGSPQFRIDDVVLTGVPCDGPEISGISPGQGPAGTVVTVAGSGFQNPSPVTNIQIDGVTVAEWSIISDTEIELVIPESGGSGTINLFRNDCVKSSAVFDKISNDCIIGNTNALIISELSDPFSNALTDRYIEIYNPTNSTIDLSGWEVEAVSNNSVCATWMLSGTISPGEAKTCGTNAPVNGGPHDFSNAGNNWNIITSSCIVEWNGQARDGAYLYYNTTLIDFAVPGTSDVLTYANQSLVRNPDICAPSTTYIASQWTAAPAPNAGEGASTPRVHTACQSTLAVGQEIDAQPADQIELDVCESTTFSIAVSNFNGTPVYQWYASLDGNTFTPLTNGGDFSGVNTAELTVSNLEDKDGLQFYSTATDGDCELVSEAAIIRLKDYVGAPGLWTNAQNNQDWFDCRNWADGRVPDAATDVVIPSGTSDPEIGSTTANAACRNLEIGNTRSVVVYTESASLGLEIYGNVSGAGNIEVLESSLTFAGSAQQTIDSDILLLDAVLNIDKPQNHLISNTDIDMLESVLQLNGGVLKMNPGAKLLTEGGAFTPGAADRFVAGTIQRTGFTADVELVLPTGFLDVGAEGPADDVLVFQPASLTAQAATATTVYEIQYFHENYNPNLNPPLVGLNSVSTCNYWIIERVAGSVDAKVGLSWNEAYCFDVTEPAALKVAWRSIDEWQPASLSTDLVVDSGDPYLTGFITSGDYLTDFGPFAIGQVGSDLNVLPIELISFTARAIDPNAVRTFWATASETNNDFFTIERSVNGQDFYVVGFVQGAGNSTQTIEYSLIDDAPENGISYYRLKQTDFDGSFAYSHIEAVQINGHDQIRINGIFRQGSEIDILYSASGGPVQFQVFDIAGKQLHSALSENQSTQRINLPALARGIYFLRLTDSQGKSVVSKFFF